MRPVFFSLVISLYASVCFGQSDSTKRTQEPAKTQVLIPGIDSPTSSPGALMQSSPRPNEVATPPGKKGAKTTPPSDPRAFGVAVPLGKAKKDTVKN